MSNRKTEGAIAGMIAHFVDQAKGKIAYTPGFMTVGQVGSRFIQTQRSNVNNTAEIVSISPEEASIRATANQVGVPYKPRPPKKYKRTNTNASKFQQPSNRPKEKF